MTTETPAPEAHYLDWPILIREATVVRTAYVTPRMLRLTFGNPGMEGFESHLPDEHMKLVFPDPETGRTRAPRQDGDHLDWPSPFPPTREYTVRHYDRERNEADIDFVVHDGGLAATWAVNARVGDTLWIAGPRASRLVPPEFGFHVLLGDETALPAIGRWLAELPADAQGVAAVEVTDAEDEQELRAPAGVRLHWLHRGGHPPGSTTLLGDFVQGIELPRDSHTYLFACGEAGSLKPVRKWARAHGIGKGQSEIAGYWKAGRTGAVPAGRLQQAAHSARHGLDHLLGREH